MYRPKFHTTFVRTILTLSKVKIHITPTSSIRKHTKGNRLIAFNFTPFFLIHTDTLCKSEFISLTARVVPSRCMYSTVECHRSKDDNRNIVYSGSNHIYKVQREVETAQHPEAPPHNFHRIGGSLVPNNYLFFSAASSIIPYRRNLATKRL